MHEYGANDQGCWFQLHLIWSKNRFSKIRFFELDCPRMSLPLYTKYLNLMNCRMCQSTFGSLVLRCTVVTRLCRGFKPQWHQFSFPYFCLTEAEAFNVPQTRIIQVTTLTGPIHNRVQYRYTFRICLYQYRYACKRVNLLFRFLYQGEFEQIYRHSRPDKSSISSSCYDVRKANTRIFDFGKKPGGLTLSYCYLLPTVLTRWA